jgi:hypothetical protein
MDKETPSSQIVDSIDAILMEAAEQHLAEVLHDDDVRRGFAGFLDQVVPSLVALIEAAKAEAVAGVATDRLELGAAQETESEDEGTDEDEDEDEEKDEDEDEDEATDEEKDAAFQAEMERQLYYWLNARKLIFCEDPYKHSDGRWTYKCKMGNGDVFAYFTATADKFYVSALSNIDTAVPEYQREFDRKNLDWGIAAKALTSLTLAAMARVQQWHHSKYGWYSPCR